jgi:hypothetical protein
MTEQEWLTSSKVYNMLEFLDGKIDGRLFMRFSVQCCKRIWHLLTDPRSRAVVEDTERFLNGEVSEEEPANVYPTWYDAYQGDGIIDAVEGNSHEAIQFVAHTGYLAAASVANACCDAVGYDASRNVRENGGSGQETYAVWRPAELAERSAQADLLRATVGNPFRTLPSSEKGERGLSR